MSTSPTSIPKCKVSKIMSIRFNFYILIYPLRIRLHSNQALNIDILCISGKKCARKLAIERRRAQIHQHIQEKQWKKKTLVQKAFDSKDTNVWSE